MTRPLAWMMASALCYSAIPLLMAATGALQTPFLFNAAYRAGGTIGGLILHTFPASHYPHSPRRQPPSTQPRSPEPSS